MAQITDIEKNVLTKMTKRYRRDINSKVPDIDANMQKVLAAQNVLRDCMTAVFIESTPFNSQFIMEMSIRLASYALSVLPVEDQRAASVVLARNFIDAHSQRIQKGVMMRASWEATDDPQVHKSDVPKGH